MFILMLLLKTKKVQAAIKLERAGFNGPALKIIIFLQLALYTREPDWVIAKIIVLFSILSFAS